MLVDIVLSKSVCCFHIPRFTERPSIWKHTKTEKYDERAVFLSDPGFTSSAHTSLPEALLPISWSPGGCFLLGSTRWDLTLDRFVWFFIWRRTRRLHCSGTTACSPSCRLSSDPQMMSTFPLTLHFNLQSDRAYSLQLFHHSMNPFLSLSLSLSLSPLKISRCTPPPLLPSTLTPHAPTLHSYLYSGMCQALDFCDVS